MSTILNEPAAGADIGLLPLVGAMSTLGADAPNPDGVFALLPLVGAMST